MSEEREEVYQILELGKHLKNLHHKKGFGGLLFIDLSMIKFSNLSSYIRQLDKENEELKKQLHDASIQIQELIEKDIWCPSNCDKLKELRKQYCERTDCSGRIGNSKKVEELQRENKKQKEVIDKAVLELANIDGNLSNSQLSDRICNLIDILKEVE